jgi:PiT family inorganic phosphate transporter
MGAGATKRFSAVRWGMARSIVGGWVLTFPAAGSAAALVYLLLKFVFRLP